MTQEVWYYLQQGTPTGPYTTQQLWGLRIQALVEEKTLVWQPGMATWKSFREAVPPLPGRSVPKELHAECLDQRPPSNLGEALDLRNVRSAEISSNPTLFKRLTSGVSRLGGVAIAIIAFAIIRSISHGPTMLTESKTDEMLQQIEGWSSLYRTIKTNFPSDYEAMVFNFTRIANETKDAKKIQLEAAQEVARIRKKYAENIVNASDTNLIAYLNSLSGLYNSVLQAEGVKKCNEAAAKGPIALDGQKYKAELNAIGSDLFEALSQSLRSPVNRPQPTQDDWDGLHAKMKLLGTPQEHFDVLDREDVSSPVYCVALIELVSSVASFEGEPGARIRAAMAKGFAEE